VCWPTYKPPSMHPAVYHLVWVWVWGKGKGEGGSTYYNIVYIQQSTQSQYHEALSLGQPTTYFQFQYVQELDMVNSALSPELYTYTTCSSDGECGLEWSHGLEVHLQTLLKVGKESVPSWHKDILEEGKEATGTLLVSVSKTLIPTNLIPYFCFQKRKTVGIKNRMLFHLARPPLTFSKQYKKTR